MADRGTSLCGQGSHDSARENAAVVAGRRRWRHRGFSIVALVTLLGAAALSSAAAGSGSFTSSLVRTTDVAAISPASPDPSGLAYVPSSGTFLMTDGEVDETVDGITHFAGANLWELTLSGAVVRTSNLSPVAPTQLALTKEPTGIAFDSVTGHAFVTDDDAGRVYEIDPGVDGHLGTADDGTTFFSTLAAGNDDSDPEGIAYSPASNHLFVADGYGAEIYEYTRTGLLVNHFDTARWGVDDNESVELDPATNTLLVLSNHANRFIAELSTSGALLRTIDVSAANALAPAGLATAPASDGSGAKRFYIVDRAVDNNTDPTAVDGRLYELTAPATAGPAGTPPVVDAGADPLVVLPATGALDATVTDDGTPSSVTTTWSQVSGPSTASFGNPAAADTTVSFPIIGEYVLRLTATDGEWTQSDDIVATVTGVGATLTADIPIVANPAGGPTSTDDAEERGAAAASSPKGMHLTSADLDLLSDLGTSPLVPMGALGLRFQNIPIKPGQAITNAYVQFTADEASSAATNLTIQAQAADSAATFTTASSGITNRPRTTTAVPWAPPAWVAVGDAATAQRTPNLAGIVQEVVNRQGWAAGNALALIVTGSSTGGRVARAFDEPKGGRAVLHLEFLHGIANRPPAVTLAAPTTGLSVAQGTSISFSGSASDPEDGNLTSGLVWRSNLDDEIGTGGAFSTATLTVGTHTVTASVTDDGALVGSASVVVTVTPPPPNQPPAVSAGPNRTVTFPGPATLAGTATDDGLPAGGMSSTWSQVSGPGVVGFGDAASPVTTVTFTATGTYVLRLTATDTLLTASSDVTVTVNAPNPATLTFAAEADAYVASTTPSANFGAATALQVRTATGSTKNAFLTFAVSGVQGRTVTSARVRLTVSDASISGGGIFATSPSWTETGLVWGNQPAPSGPALATLGAVARGTTVEFPVTAAVSGDGTVGFLISSSVADAVYYAPRESSTPPQLVMTVE